MHCGLRFPGITSRAAHPLKWRTYPEDDPMRSRTRFACVSSLLFACCSAILAQAPVPRFTPIAPIALDHSGPVIHAHAEALKPFTVAGERGVVLGQQDGTYEAWVLPVKLLSHMTIEADIEGYTVPIDVNQQAAEIEVRPDRTVITYAHIGFTVRQIMFSPEGGPAGTGPVVLFEFDCLHPTDFTFRFTPALEYMWPERNEGHPGPEWVAPGPGPNDQAGGYYVLHADYPDLAGAVTIPGARPGILAPYQERPQVHPVELRLHIDPARDRDRLYPLLMAVGTNTAAANTRALGATLEKLNQELAATYQAHAESYKTLLGGSVSIDTPDKSLNEAFQWAVVSIEQLKAKPVGTDETALVAGYYASGDSARPGFGWFFGRDALYTLYAVNGYGDFPLAKSELEFLIHRQRADGKIMHEYSQTATQIDWQQFPYMYAAADSTPLFIMAVADYVRTSGDTGFLTAHRDAIEKAYAFLIDPAHDTDHDGIYDNSQGTGWVESWPGGMPHQEIYLAELDQQASDAYARLQRLLGNAPQADAARKRARAITATIEREYYDPQSGCYAFATNPAGTPNSPVDRTRTVYPALAWWSRFEGQPLEHADACVRQFAAHDLNTDWGLRDVSNEEKIYDGMSYHQGSVWPLFTGWAALAEFGANQPLAGYQMLMENANLTKAQDLGADTELLSGDFFVPFGRSTSHQLWSSAMVITPTLRGLFGISIDAQAKTITVDPELPASWDHAEVRHIPVGNSSVDLLFTRNAGYLTWQIQGANPVGIKLATTELGAQQHGRDRIDIPEPAVAIDVPVSAPLPGARTSSVRVLNQSPASHFLKITLEAPAGSSFRLPLFTFWPVQKLDVSGAELSDNGSVLTGRFPEGDGWKTTTVTLTW